MAEIRATLTELGNREILKKGIYKTITQWGASDQGYLYDVTTDPNLEYNYVGGKRTLVTQAFCEQARVKPISKDKMSEEDLKLQNLRLRWEVSKTEECVGSTFTVTNPDITFDLSEWFNYLTSITGEGNYDYNNMLTVPIVDNVTAVQEKIDSGTRTWSVQERINDITFEYKFSDQKSCDAYSSLNAVNMGVRDGVKVISNEINKRFPSNMLLMFDSIDNTGSYIDRLTMAMTPTWVYAFIPKNTKDTVFHFNNTISIKDLEKLTADEIDSRYDAILPAAITTINGGDTNLYVLTDPTGNYTNSKDGASTFTHRFTNSNGQTLIDGMIAKAKKYIVTNFEVDVNNSNRYTKTIEFNINNKTVNNITYPVDNIVGGKYKLTFVYDTTTTTGVYDNISTLTNL